MTIPSNVPSNLRTPGSYQEFDFSGGGQQLVTLERRIAILAEKSAAGTAVALTPVQLFGDLDGDTKCGKGSLAALMNRQARLQAKISGFGEPEIWVVPIAEPGGGTAAQYTITVTGPATEAKDLILKLAGRVLSVGVNNADAAATIATAIKNKCDELKAILPFTAGVAGAVVTLTWVTKGVNGNGLMKDTVQTPAGVTIAYANSVAGAGTIDPTAALATLYDKDYLGIALSNHVTADAAALLADAAFAWGFGQKSYRFYAMGENGSIGTAQTLQGSYNDYRFQIVSCENCKSLPGEMAVAQLTAWVSRDVPNANLDDERLALYTPDPVDAFTATEVETCLASGLTPLVPDGPFVKVVRLMTTQITLSGAPFEPLREPALPRTGAYMAKQYDAGFKQGFRQEVLFSDPEGVDDPLLRARRMLVMKQRSAEKLRILRDVDSFLTEIKAEISPNVPGRILTQTPMRVAGPLHQLANLNILYLA